MWDCERNQEAKFFYNSPRLPGGTGQKGYSRNDTPIIPLKHRNNQEFRYIRVIYIRKLVLRLVRVTSEKKAYMMYVKLQ